MFIATLKENIASSSLVKLAVSKFDHIMDDIFGKLPTKIKYYLNISKSRCVTVSFVWFLFVFICLN